MIDYKGARNFFRSLQARPNEDFASLREDKVECRLTCVSDVMYSRGETHDSR